jgi:hypothetical protein
MAEVRTVTLEILRHGPAHNQLLSPLTQYMALCGNHSPETIHVPFEHQEFMARLRTLRYQDSDSTLAAELQTMARRITEMLSIRSLIAELANSRRQGESLPLTDLRIVVSAAELAMLPFELAMAPAGCPGEGQQLALQNRLPLTITRQIRRVSNATFRWPEQPRILFVAASPPEVGAVPLQAHLLCLRRLIEPWMRPWNDEPSRRQRLAEIITFLPDASIEAIEEACRAQSYSHVHVLAHGIAVRGQDDLGFGLALHHAHDPGRLEVIDGQRLAEALRTARGSDSALSCPAVVTVASCDSGSGGSLGAVLGAGASIAHALHEAGIPLVVASQFPLSFEGSVIFTECLYEDLLWGDDPRVSLSRIRRRLHSRLSARHDWASLVFYAAWPQDIDEQLRRHRVRRANESVRWAMGWADNLLAPVEKHLSDLQHAAMGGAPAPDTSSGPQLIDADVENVLRACLERIQQGKGRLERLIVEDKVHHEPEDDFVLGLLASAEKREAQLLWTAYRFFTRDATAPPNAQRQAYLGLVRERLERSLGYYRQTLEQDARASWAIVQYLSLVVVLDKAAPEYASFWQAARGLAEADEIRGGTRQVCWALSSLAELYLLAFAEPVADLALSKPQIRKRAIDACRALKAREQIAPMEIYSARRQLLRYWSWYSHLSPEIATPEFQELLDDMLDALP